MGHLTELTIRSFRHAAPCTLRFSPGMNVVVGRNGTGKSNLLTLLQCVAALDFRPLRDELFDVSWVWVHEDLVLRMAFRCDGESPSKPGAVVPWSLDLSVESDGERSMEVRCDERTLKGWFLDDRRGRVAVGQPGAPEPWAPGLATAVWLWFCAAAREVDGTVVEQWQRLIVGLWRVHEARSLDEGVDVYRSWVEAQPSTFELLWMQVGSQEGAWLSRGLPTSMVPPRSSRPSDDSLRFDRATLPWLGEFCDLAGLADVRLRLSVSEARPTHVRYASWDVLAQLGEQTLLRGADLSYGQKRLLVSLLVREAAPDVFLADELSNGLHHEWVESLALSLEGRQSFLTTQDAILLDMHPVFDVAEVQRSIVLCGRSESGWTWRQLDEERATDVVRAAAVGLQPVSEILLVRGLW